MNNHDGNDSGCQKRPVTYLVRWEIEVIAASPTGAARNALIIQRDKPAPGIHAAAKATGNSEGETSAINHSIRHLIINACDELFFEQSARWPFRLLRRRKRHRERSSGIHRHRLRIITRVA